MPAPRRSLPDSQEQRLILIFGVVLSLLLGLAFLAVKYGSPAMEPGDMTETLAPLSRSAAPPVDLAPAGPPAAPTPDPAPPQNVLITANKTYVLPPAQPNQDARTLAALERNCQAATRRNAEGDYPAMQRQACNDYQRFAGRMGLQPQMPAVRERVQQPSIHVPESSAPEQQPDECASLYAEKRVIDNRLRQPNSVQVIEQLNGRRRFVTDRLARLGCRETG